MTQRTLVEQSQAEALGKRAIDGGIVLGEALLVPGQAAVPCIQVAGREEKTPCWFLRWMVGSGEVIRGCHP